MKFTTLFLLCAVFFCGQLHAQEDAPTGQLYYKVTELNHAAGDFMEAERTMMLPYFQARVNAGTQVWHGLFKILLPSGEQASADYVAVDVYANLADLNLPPEAVNEVIATTFPNATVQEFWERIAFISDDVSTGVFIRQGAVNPLTLTAEDREGELSVVNSMLVPPGSEQAYVAMENEVFAPIMREHVKEGKMNSWGVYSRMLPGGTDFGANFGTVDAFDDWAQMEAHNQAFFATAQRVHPDKNLEELGQRLNELREMTRSTVRQLMTHTTPPSSEEITFNVLTEGGGPKAMRGQEVTWKVKVMDAAGGTLFQTADLGDNFQQRLGNDPYDRIWSEAALLVGKGGIVQVSIPESRQSYAQRRSGSGGVVIHKVTVDKIDPPVAYAHDKMSAMLSEKGLTATRAWYSGLKRDNPRGYVFREAQMNVLGYELMAEGKADAAVYVLKLNCENYPDSFNTYDSLADAYHYAGNDFHAKQNYELALEHNPESTETAAKLSRLK